MCDDCWNHLCDKCQTDLSETEQRIAKVVAILKDRVVGGRFSCERIIQRSDHEAILKLLGATK